MIKNVKIVIKSSFLTFTGGGGGVKLRDKMVISAYISFARENESVKHDLVEFKVQCLKVFCYHGQQIYHFAL